jgi:hypothetical protein
LNLWTAAAQPFWFRLEKDGSPFQEVAPIEKESSIDLRWWRLVFTRFL